MKKTNTILWENVEAMAVQYEKATNKHEKDDILASLFFEMDDYIQTCIRNATTNARNYGLSIPAEDFESRYFQYLWEAAEAYKTDGSTFKNIVMRRFDFAEKHTWRQYRTKGDDNDKNGVSYESARLDSLDREINGQSEEERTMADVALEDAASAEAEYLDMTDEVRILTEFEAVNPRYANVIRYMAAGYDGDALAVVTGEGDEYGTKMRKLVQRAKKSFAAFIVE